MHTHGGQQIIAICTYFVLAILYFALAYDWLYTKNYNHFLFNAEILKRQKIAVRNELEKDLGRLHLNLQHLQELSSALMERRFTILMESAPGEVFLQSGYRYVFGPTDSSGTTIPSTIVTVFDEKGSRASRYALPIIYTHPLRPEQFLEIAREAIRLMSQMCRGTEERLASISSDTPQVWGFWDFIYFSAVIQTTIGLGDILPNSTLVRKLVVLQVIIGYGLLSVALNLVLSQAH
jgi:ion channel